MAMVLTCDKTLLTLSENLEHLGKQNKVTTLARAFQVNIGVQVVNIFLEIGVVFFVLDSWFGCQNLAKQSDPGIATLVDPDMSSRSQGATF